MIEADDRRSGGEVPCERLLAVADALRRGAPVPELERRWLLDALVKYLTDAVSLEEALGISRSALRAYQREQRDRWLRKAAEFVESEHRAIALEEAIRKLERRRRDVPPPSNPLLLMLWRAKQFGRLPGRRQLRRIFE